MLPRNNIDAVEVAFFINDNGKKNGIIIAYNGFLQRRIQGTQEKNKEQKRNSKLIKAPDTLSWGKTIYFCGSVLLYRKTNTNANKYLYLLRVVYMTEKEDTNYVDGSIKKEFFYVEKHKRQNGSLGTIVFDSNLDLSKKVYRIYSERWLLELMFSYFKGEEVFITLNVQSIFRVISEKFVNFVAIIRTTKMARRSF